MDSGLLAASRLNFCFLAAPGLDSGLSGGFWTGFCLSGGFWAGFSAPGLDSGFLAASGLDSGLLAACSCRGRVLFLAQVSSEKAVL